ncbi:Yip1 family protein [Sphingobium lignivorans]|uniref:Yip1 domain-containing protein n=1 Tax=Sphingobium lignivorans TaxID=2735886 RepID=A0ABR6NFY3_9SPHN|nr:Yip1 family protein [Sphingobium lignivorans]MBB5986186.1 hypothetical protein [Sphingobium lignivorans]
MTVETPAGPGGDIAARAKAIILKPRDEWPVIARETTPSGEVFTRYAVPLAAIGPVASFLGGQIFGYGAFGISFRPSIMGSLSIAVGGYILSLVGIFVLSFIANKLAASFGGESSSRNAFKLVVYSMTASWLAGIFSLVPSLSLLGIVGLYSFYLFYVGAAPMMKVPGEKALTYTIVTVICAILLYFVTAAIVGAIGGMFGASSWDSPSVSEGGGSISIPGVGTFDTDKIEQAGRDMESAIEGNVTAAAPADLQSLLPASIGAYQRVAVESARAGPGSTAEGTYEAGDRRFTLKIADIAIAGAWAGMASAFGVEANREDADGYERTSTVDGNLVIEKWDRSAGDGKFATIVGKRFIIEAEGDAASIDELKAAVASIDQGKLATLGKS